MTAGTAPQRGWYYGWNIVAVCVLSQIAANGLTVNAFSLFLQGWATEFHKPVSAMQLGLAACGMGCALIAPLVGMLADKYPARPLLSAGVLGMGLFCLGISFVTAPWQFYALYGLLAPVALCLSTSVPANAVVSRWFVRRLGLALGLTAFGLGMAGVVMPPIVAAVMPDLGWRMVWRIGGVVILLVVLPLVALVVRDRPAARDGTHYLTRDDAGGPVRAHGHGHGGGAGAGGLRWRDILGRRNFWILVIVYLPMLGLHGGVGQNLSPIAASRGLSQQTAGILLSLLSASQIAAMLAGGMLSDRFGNRLPLVGLAMATAVGGLLVAFGGGVVSLGAGAMLAGLGGAFWPLLAAAVAAEFGARGVGRAFGMLTFFLPVAVLTPFAVAKAQESTGSYGSALTLMAALCVAAGLACLLFLRERRDARPGVDLAIEPSPLPIA